MRTSPRSGSVWHQHPKAFALNNICKMKGRSSAKLKVCFSPFYKRCKGFTLLLVLQESALSNGDKLPDMRRWWASAGVLLAAAAQQRGGRVKYLFAFTSFRSYASYRQNVYSPHGYLCTCVRAASTIPQTPAWF